jgi:5S rRNA maturation endonuclease (ribonuclease M5)
MNRDEELELFLEILDELKGKTVVVEGKKDLMAMIGLGFEVIPINMRHLADIIPLLEGKEVVILTDFDPEGRRLYIKLKYLLTKYKIKSNSRLRGKMMSLKKTRIEDFRKLSASVRALKKEGDCYGETSANVNKIHNPRNDKGERCSGKTRCNWSDFWSDRRIAWN